MAFPPGCGGCTECPPGPPGRPGAPGSVWYSGPGVPAGGLGINGDQDLNTTNGDVYEKNAGVWILTGNIKGTAGTNGTNGAPGSVWYTGAGAPAGGLGIDGDFYLRSSNGDVYQKAGGVWGVVANITGPAGSNGTNGTNGTNGPGYVQYTNVGTAPTAASTRYEPFQGAVASQVAEASADQNFPIAVTLSNMRVRIVCSAGAMGDTLTLTSRKNGGAGAQTVVLTKTVNGAETIVGTDGTNSDAYSAGDRGCTQSVGTGTLAATNLEISYKTA